MIIEYQTRLNELREERNLLQKDVAKLLNTSRSNYSTWELNTKFIPLKHLNNYCNIFNVSMDYVFYLSKSRGNTINKTYKLNKKIIAENLKKFMSDRNITQVELAKVLNTTQSTISSYVNGKTLIITSFLYQIAKEYNVSMDEICNRK